MMPGSNNAGAQQHMVTRALIVEDTPSIRDELEQIVFPMVDHVHPAGTLAEAEQLIGELSFDVVVLDLRLKDGSGLKLLERLLRPHDALPDQPHSRTPVIVISSTMDISLRQRALDLGAVDVISKPFQPMEVQRRIQRVLEQCHRGGEMESATHIASFHVDGRTLRVLATDRTVRLRKRDALLLSILEPHEERVFPVDILVEWMSDSMPVTEAQVIRSLRRLDRILTVHGGRSGWLTELSGRRFRYRPE